MNAREGWLEERRKGVGGSDAAAALGQSRRKTMFELYHEKIGSTNIVGAAGLDVIERIEFGKAMEAVIAEMYAKRYNVKLRRHNRIAHHTQHSFMLASYDRTIDGKKEGIECKNVDALAYRLSGDWGDEHSDEVPLEYLMQCHHYLAVSGYEVWHLAACVGGNQMKVFHIERDPEMIDMIVDGEAAFWKFVERHEAPPLDYQHPTAIGLLKKIYPGTNGETVRLPPEAETMHYAKLQFDEEAALNEAGSKAAKARILHLMGEASVGLLPNGGGYTRKIVERKAYEVEASKYLDFRFSSRKGAGQ
ncbi:YqaJ viral recombinase family protein [Paraburkholderia sp. BR14263]|uniref:YqaJ viral recombinase family nuclease n=1 Tax=unclassified Paraburkholderia TaxID=2615204 RepID=UPI0034CDAA34